VPRSPYQDKKTSRADRTLNVLEVNRGDLTVGGKDDRRSRNGHKQNSWTTPVYRYHKQLNTINNTDGDGNTASVSDKDFNPLPREKWWGKNDQRKEGTVAAIRGRFEGRFSQSVIGVGRTASIRTAGKPRVVPPEGPSPGYLRKETSFGNAGGIVCFPTETSGWNPTLRGPGV